ncbi:eukaryotic aspartyl protease family protein [Stylonychia lemnae]|uniref:Eukaryotic aspartyl protease family protein n=1 Tax=Stylonychia lemnae TaxID=5949 RepID=A0A078AV42_STYLE|nr:eukaryotic aspartyl protease family protein [Stylonychia lemnae]|eukprot:CDW86074.1 eukaryotic aspartyl protease family protein [Stylonychia lemnae]
MTDPQFTGYDGVLGLKPQNGSSFIEQLYSQGFIDEPTLGLFLKDKDNYLDSELMVGGFDTSKMKNKDALIWMKLPQRDYWAVSLKNAQFGDEQFMMSNQNYVVEFNPNQFYISVPRDDYRRLVVLFLKNHGEGIESCKLSICKVKDKCSDFPKKSAIRFTIGAEQEIFEISSSVYLIDDEETGGCILGVIGTVQPKQNKYIFGSIFLSRYYSIYDQKNQSIGLTLNRDYSEYDAKINIPVHLIVLTCISALLFLICLVSIVIFSIKKVLKQKNKENNKTTIQDIDSQYSFSTFSKRTLSPHHQNQHEFQQNNQYIINAGSADNRLISLNYLDNGFDGISKINGNSDSGIMSSQYRVQELKEHLM